MRTLFSLALILTVAVVLNAKPIPDMITLSVPVNDANPECGPASVQFYNGASPLGPLLTAPSSGRIYSMDLDTRTLPNGIYHITAKAADHNGNAALCDGSTPNTASSGPIVLVVNHADSDSAVPMITVTPPPSALAGKMQVVRVAVTDPMPIQKISIRINGAVKASNANRSDLSFRWNTDPYRGQTVRIDAVVLDAAGNSTVTTSMVTVRK
jgi:hypothetical protein